MNAKKDNSCCMMTLTLCTLDFSWKLPVPELIVDFSHLSDNIGNNECGVGYLPGPS